MGRGLPANIQRRCLCREAAAEYVGVSPCTFDGAVKEGLFPKPIVIGRRNVWDRTALDRSLDVLSGLGNPVDIDLDAEFEIGARSTA